MVRLKKILNFNIMSNRNAVLLFLINCLLFSFNSFSQLMITEIADPDNSSSAGRFIEIYNNSSIFRLYNLTSGEESGEKATFKS